VNQTLPVKSAHLRKLLQSGIENLLIWLLWRISLFDFISNLNFVGILYQLLMRHICFESVCWVYQVTSWRGHKCLWILYTGYLYTFSARFWILWSSFFLMLRETIISLPFEGSFLYVCQKLHGIVSFCRLDCICHIDCRWQRVNWFCAAGKEQKSNKISRQTALSRCESHLDTAVCWRRFYWILSPWKLQNLALQLCLEHLLFWEKFSKILYKCLHVKYPLFLSDFNDT
jgi:hypothetical protein